MAKASDNLFPYVHLVPAVAPASPTAGAERVFLDSADGKLKRKNSAGTVTVIEGAAGAGAFSGVTLTKSSAQSVTQATETPVTWDGELFDTDAYHDNATNNSRITIPATGKYMVGASVTCLSLAVGKTVAVFLKKNGVFLAGGTYNRAYAAAAGDLGLSFSALLPLTAADYLEVIVYQTDTVARSVDTSANGATFWAQKVG